MSDTGEMTVKEAGRRGGTATVAKHGAEHMQRIARLAGRPPPEERRRISSLGGRAVQAKLGQEERRALGRKGGVTTRERYGVEHYRAAGRARWERKLDRELERSMERSSSAEAGL